MVVKKTEVRPKDIVVEVYSFQIFGNVWLPKIGKSWASLAPRWTHHGLAHRRAPDPLAISPSAATFKLYENLALEPFDSVRSGTRFVAPFQSPVIDRAVILSVSRNPPPFRFSPVELLHLALR